ncbi:AraC family transcriptional regulator [Leptospira barantonii]|uniref:AraC family transcriptional regulator n=1 Tax=Leptospira barantonii TaxID=2023184 RepID=A0A5F2BKL2_9LEPT|nr:AraC family transcriptional regulator [Leptospira barantonii]TGM04690.1 AraC family transcriptional regulator [Leptospira barantonii]
MEGFISTIYTIKDFVFLDEKVYPISVCAQVVAMLWGLIGGVSDLLRFKKVRMNLARAANFFSIVLMMILYNAATYLILSPALLHPTLSHKIFFGLYFGVSFYSIVSGTFYFLYIVDVLEKPEKYSAILSSVFPFFFALAYFSENLIFPVYLTNVLIILALLAECYLAVYSVYVKKAPKIYLNYTVLCGILVVAYSFRIYGIEVSSPDMLVMAYLAFIYCVVYVSFLQFYFPGFSWKDSKQHNGEPTSVAMFDKTVSEESSNETKTLPRKNLLDGVNIRVIENRTDRFLKEKVFLDEELRLPDFAAYLGLTVHQASYFLNHCMKSNFPEFLNFHRMEEAKRMIQDRTNLNLLDIALACGFNSPSSFHRASVKFSGLPPRELKKEILEKTLGMSYELNEEPG